MVKDTTISLALGYHEMRSNRPTLQGKEAVKEDNPWGNYYPEGIIDAYFAPEKPLQPEGHNGYFVYCVYLVTGTPPAGTTTAFPSKSAIPKNPVTEAPSGGLGLIHACVTETVNVSSLII